MPRPAPPRRVSRGTYWSKKLQDAPTLSAQLGEACDYLRAEAARYPDQKAAAAVLQGEINRLIARAKQLAKATDRARRTRS